MNSSSMRGIFRSPSLLVRWGATLPTTPFTGPFRVWMSTRCAFVTAAVDEGAHPEYLGKDDIQKELDALETTAEGLMTPAA